MLLSELLLELNLGVNKTIKIFNSNLKVVSFEGMLYTNSRRIFLFLKNKNYNVIFNEELTDFISEGIRD